MAELTDTTDACCAPEQQASCCAPDEKTDCCGHGEGCGCQAGARRNPPLGGVVRTTLRELPPAVAESLTPPEGADASVLGASTDELRGFALDGLTRRLNIIGVPIDTL